ncbi:pilus assembly FimT family protein [Candidatus Magnetominusculus xianensis]|nr:type II secretion system protein [Candidatus Magnetominusculus xianensis]MBF0403780.1 type II secretion system protein [Nitrospirota bacterium]
MNAKAISKCDCDSGGFTLIEVFISIAIIGGLLMTAIYTLNHHLAIVSRHRVITTASALAVEKLRDSDRLNITEDKGKFPPPFTDFTYEIKSITSTYSDIKIKELTVRYGDEKISLRRLYRKP